MRELFTTLHYLESNDVLNILRNNHIDRCLREERRENGLRYCIYVHAKDLDRSAELVNDGLSELESERRGES